MNIWIFRSALGLALLALTGCLEAPAVNSRDFGFARSAPQTIAVANQSVVIGGPPGYCIDRGGSRVGGDTAFVLLGSCASIARDAAAGAPRVPGILTASVDKENGGAAVLAHLERFVGSPEGRAAMARDGSAESVSVLDTLNESGALFVYLRDTSANSILGLDDTYWRGFFDLNGRLITVSAVSFANQPQSGDAGLATLRAFLARIRSESPNISAEAAGAVAPEPRKKLLGFLNR